jgi:hypothetical protein
MISLTIQPCLTCIALQDHMLVSQSLLASGLACHMLVSVSLLGGNLNVDAKPQKLRPSREIQLALKSVS